MPSIALQSWRNQRIRHLDDLLVAHRLVRGSAPGRRRRMAAVNAALVIRLAAEFQGFVRDLHDEASVVFAAWTASGNTVAQKVIGDVLMTGRDIDRGNAHPGSITRDFRRLGLDVWEAMAIRDSRTSQINTSLARLYTARNALAHADTAKLAVLRAHGCRIVLGTFRHWRRDLDVLANNLDAEVGTWLGRTFYRNSPW